MVEIGASGTGEEDEDEELFFVVSSLAGSGLGVRMRSSGGSDDELRFLCSSAFSSAGNAGTTSASSDLCASSCSFAFASSFVASFVASSFAASFPSSGSPAVAMGPPSLVGLFLAGRFFLLRRT